MSDITDWFKSLPLITRWWFILSIVLPVLGRFGLLNPYYMVLLYEPIVYKFQIWRPVTSVFFYVLSQGSGFHYLINLYFLYNYSVRLETGLFDGRPADYLFMLLFNWVCIVAVQSCRGYFPTPQSLVLSTLSFDLELLMDPMILSVLYVWCQTNKDQIVQFWFGTQFKAMYLPWVLLAFNMILSGGGIMELVGIVVGHLYFFLMFKYPQDFGGRSWLTTPQIL
ncbi:Derlin-1 [Nymphon striatum]|nr:Derlin-1 [Nymphon striatum]